MTGWRVGWMVVPESHIRLIERLLPVNMSICAPHASQVAALGVFDETELKDNLKVYKRNRELMIEGLFKLDSLILYLDGAFYIYADIRDSLQTYFDFCKDMLNTVGVAITPGLDFDPNEVKQAQFHARSNTETGKKE